MVENVYPAATAELAARRTRLAPDINDAFENFSRTVIADGALGDGADNQQRTGTARQARTEEETAQSGRVNAGARTGRCPRSSDRSTGAGAGTRLRARASVHNTQPWRWRLDGDVIDLFAESAGHCLHTIRTGVI